MNNQEKLANQMLWLMEGFIPPASLDQLVSRTVQSLRCPNQKSATSMAINDRTNPESCNNMDINIGAANVSKNK